MLSLNQNLGSYSGPEQLPFPGAPRAPDVALWNEHLAAMIWSLIAASLQDCSARGQLHSLHSRPLLQSCLLVSLSVDESVDIADLLMRCALNSEALMCC